MNMEIFLWLQLKEWMQRIGKNFIFLLFPVSNHVTFGILDSLTSLAKADVSPIKSWADKDNLFVVFSADGNICIFHLYEEKWNYQTILKRGNSTSYISDFKMTMILPFCHDVCKASNRKSPLNCWRFQILESQLFFMLKGFITWVKYLCTSQISPL